MNPVGQSTGKSLYMYCSCSGGMQLVVGCKKQQIRQGTSMVMHYSEFQVACHGHIHAYTEAMEQ